VEVEDGDQKTEIRGQKNDLSPSLSRRDGASLEFVETRRKPQKRDTSYSLLVIGKTR